MDSPNLCRCCLTQDCSKNIFANYFFEGEAEVYYEMLRNTFNITLNNTTIKKDLICNECVSSLRQATRFRKMVEASEKTLLKVLADNVSVTLKEEKMEYDDELDLDDTVDDTCVWDDGDTELKPDMKGDLKKTASTSSDEDCESVIDRETHLKSLSDFDNLPPKSKEKYLKAYNAFLTWRKAKKMHSFSEELCLRYFKELADKYKPSSLWCLYSMLKSTIMAKDKVDLKTYTRLCQFLQRKSNGYVGRKLKMLSSADVDRFLKEAPDHIYLGTKVVIIFCRTGGCKRQELIDIKVKDVETHGEIILVKIKKSENDVRRTFTIHGAYFKTVKKYEGLRSKKAKHDRFFQNYNKGKCTAQPMGINKFTAMARDIAKFLNLPDVKAYTGLSFSRRVTTSTVSEDKKHRRRSEDGREQIPNISLSKIQIKIEPIDEFKSEPESGELLPSTSQDSSFKKEKSPKIEMDSDIDSDS